MLVSACPGGGKTTLIAAKIVRELHALEETAGKLLCLTYTRAAVASLREKLMAALGDAELPGCFISTIHGFALRQIVRPYHGCVGFDEPPRLVTTQSTEYIDILREVLDDPNADPEKLRNVRRTRDGEAKGGDAKECDAATKLWSILESLGLVDLTSLLYFAFRLLHEQSWIAAAIAARYEWIIVDEYQDTGDLAIGLLECLRIAAEAKFMLVGDGRQTIYGFAGVEPGQLSSFIESTIQRRFDLTGSFRCGQAVCNDASKLFPSRPFTSNRAEGDDQSVTEYCHVDASVNGVKDTFLPKLQEIGIKTADAAILCAWRKPLLPIAAELQTLGIPTTGEATRLYEDTFLSRFAESFVAYARTPIARNARKMKEALLAVLSDTDESVDVWQYGEQIETLYTDIVAAAFELSAQTVKDQLMGVVQRLIAVSDSLGLRLASSIATQWTGLFIEMERMESPLTTLAEQAHPISSVTLSTIHGSKGLEYRAVAIVRLNSGVLPGFYIKDKKGLAEERRKLFVAITRAMDYVLYISDREGINPSPSNFLKIIEPTTPSL